MNTKQIYRRLLTIAILLGAAASGAHAQFSTTGTYVVTGADNSGTAVVAAGAAKDKPDGGNSESLTVFQSAIASAFTNGTGGDITFDTAAHTATSNSLTATYGVAQGNTLTITNTLPATSYSIATDLGNATSGSTFLGYSGTIPTNFTYNFSQNLSDFGIMVINRFATRNLTFTVTLSDGSVVTPNASPVPTSGGANPTNPVFFEYSATGPATITSVNFATPDGLTRFDDLGFVTAVAAPEPSQYAAFSIGLLGLGVLALRARRRSLAA